MRACGEKDEKASSAPATLSAGISLVNEGQTEVRRNAEYLPLRALPDALSANPDEPTAHWHVSY